MRNYETRVLGDAFAGLSTAEENAFIDAYNECRTDAQRAAVIRRFKIKGAETRESVRSQAPKAADPQFTDAERDLIAKRRWLERIKYDPYYWD